MYIAPDSDIKILRGVPLDTTYEHTIFFSDVSNQTAFFSAKSKYSLTDQSYQRVNKGTMRVGIKADSLYDCNYLMFRNTAFGNKWFYAFISTVEYVNNATSEVTYEIDVMQTWFFDYRLNPCFVEREHTTSDAIGDNIIPENLNVGEYVYNSYKKLIDLSTMAVLVGVVDTEGETVSGKIYDGVYGGAELFAFNSGDWSGVNQKLAEFIKKPDSVVSVYLAPSAIVGGFSSGQSVPARGASLGTIESVPRPKKGDKLDGYTPKNQKLYTYPYCYESIDNSSGTEMALRYEFSLADTLQVHMAGTITQPVTATLRPVNYKGISGNEVMQESINLTGLPQCSWNFDSYQAWVAQNSVPMALNTATQLGLGTVASLATGNFIGLAATAIGAVTSLLSQGYQASIAADVSRGNLNNGNVNVGNQKVGFYSGRKSVSAQYAKMIDDYFSRFGYAVKQIKTGNRNTRPHWNYLKTVSATLTGSVPADDMRKICQIYDAGVTFWADGNEVGNYFLDNSI